MSKQEQDPATTMSDKGIPMLEGDAAEIFTLKAHNNYLKYQVRKQKEENERLRAALRDLIVWQNPEAKKEKPFREVMANARLALQSHEGGAS